MQQLRPNLYPNLLILGTESKNKCLFRKISFFPLEVQVKSVNHMLMLQLHQYCHHALPPSMSVSGVLPSPDDFYSKGIKKGVPQSLKVFPIGFVKDK